MMMMMMKKKKKCSTRCSLALMLVLFKLIDGSMAEATLRSETGTSLHVDQYGDIYDCVDINMQPTLQHPLLKNHTVQMMPSSYPAGMDENSAPVAISESRLSAVGCPPGQIPIRRYNHMQKQYFMSNVTRVLPWKFRDKKDRANKEASIAYYAAAYGGSTRVHGVKGSFCVYEPEVKLENNQTDHVETAAMMFVGSNSKPRNFISAGWIVRTKNMFGCRVIPADKDKHTRFHINWKAGNKVCIDHLCPGFVQVSSDVALGSRLAPVSIYGGPQYQITLLIFKDIITGNWWLAFGEDLKSIGYWPKSQFINCLDVGEYVAWGGSVIAPSSTPSSQMGSGHFPSEGYGKAASVTNAETVNYKNNALVTPDPKYFVAMGDAPKCYGHGDLKVGKGGLFFYYGGPGGCKG